jgi:hypothetical protein
MVWVKEFKETYQNTHKKEYKYEKTRDAEGIFKKIFTENTQGTKQQ